MKGLLLCFLLAPLAYSQPLPDTKLLEAEGDLASTMIDGIDRFLLAELEASTAKRPAFWNRDFSKPGAYTKSLAPNRRRLEEILGLVDLRLPFEAPEIQATLVDPGLAGRSSRYKVLRVRWPALDGISGEGLLLEPFKPFRAQVVALPDADISPEVLAGLTAGSPAMHYARRLAEQGCRVLVPTLISREVQKRRSAELSHREWVYRSAFEMGRHPIGYELQKVLAAVDWFAKSEKPVGVLGWGEGGLLALYAGAVDPRIDAVGVSGYFGPRQEIWKEPLERNVFGLLEQFGDAELASMIAPRTLVVQASPGPAVEVTGRHAAPGRLVTPAPLDAQRETERALALCDPLKKNWLHFLEGEDAGIDREALNSFLLGLGLQALSGKTAAAAIPAQAKATDTRMRRQIREMEDYNQALLRESPYLRETYMKDFSTTSEAAFKESQARYRKIFGEDVIGAFDRPLLPPNPRSRKWKETDAWTGYEVQLDVFPDVFAYGILLVPKGMAEGERRPVVVCQHGLEGRPTDCIENDHRAYHDFAAKLAERGFVVFCPQNIYIFKDRFRTLQRKANPLGKSLFSIMVPQHEQITRWLGSLPYVDRQRIGFYGLSYGGKSAMRIPALVENYCLSICSADFNDWITKCVSTRARYSYVWTGEYEIWEWKLGQTFNYSDMARLIAPRPFMVERGHHDGVAPDEWVAAEFAKVRRFYAVDLKRPELTEIEWFDGPHTIHGKGTFDFLHKHLEWPER